MIDSSIYHHMKSPRGFGEIPDADVVGVGGNWDCCGPFLRIYLKFEDGVVAKAGFVTYRCPWSIAAGSVLVGLLEGRNERQLGLITIEVLRGAMGEVPANKVDCVGRAVEALNNALSQRLGIGLDANKS